MAKNAASSMHCWPAAAACALDTRVVDTFLPLVADRLYRDKRQNSEIDYGDMLESVWQSLEGDRGDALLALLRARFRYGLVDEFQDTDDLQWKIFRRIFLESGDRNTLYVVGDPKQAIYAFRGADVFTYLEAREELLKSQAASVRLVENHRSTGDLIDALNLILDDRAAPAVLSGDIRYDHPVECGRPDLRVCDAKGKPVVPVTLLKYRPDHTPASVAWMRASLGRYIAREIRGTLFDPDGNAHHQWRRLEAAPGRGQRHFHLETLAVALRRLKFGGYLREQGVPFAFYKKDGLFQTAEAYDVLDVLNAIEEPDSQSKRLKAWISPFFAVPYPDLFDRAEAPPGHVLHERLYEWKALADQERFGALFDQLAHRSGLVGRELFLSNSERELTNYLHIFEILLEQILKDRVVAARSHQPPRSRSSRRSALPAGIEGRSNIQRIESERSAVQIMSCPHEQGPAGRRSVSVPFGWHRAAEHSAARVGLSRRAAVAGGLRIGKAVVGALGRTFLDREAREENERLLHVAMTRARAKVYLPVCPYGSTKVAVNGYYEALNDRLNSLIEKGDGKRTSVKLFEQVEVRDISYETESVAAELEKENRKLVRPPANLLGLLE